MVLQVQLRVNTYARSDVRPSRLEIESSTSFRWWDLEGIRTSPAFPGLELDRQPIFDDGIRRAKRTGREGPVTGGKWWQCELLRVYCCELL